MEKTKPKHKKKRRKWKRIRNRILVNIAKWTVPFLYILYIRFVWLTSRVIDETNIVDQYKNHIPPYRVLSILWHQDVFFVPWAYRKYQGVTLASVGDAGEIITQILKLCGYSDIWRGGSSKGKKRRTKILAPFIKAFKEKDHYAIGITVDGSSGPAYKLKRGSLVIANECGCSLFIARIWCKYRFHLPTWDKTTIPLPFNKIVARAIGPYPLPSDIGEEEGLERFRCYMENELKKLSYQMSLELDGKLSPHCKGCIPSEVQEKEETI